MSGAGGTWVFDGEKKISSRLAASRPRHRILGLEDGRFAKMVMGSFRLRAGVDPDPMTRRRLVNNRLVWRFLRRNSHPGLLRVFERVVDERGDEGFICEPLTTHLLNGDFPPHPATRSLRYFLETGAHLGDALQVLHGQGKVHADVTPYNVLLRGDQSVLIDFERAVRIGQYASELPGSDEDTKTVLTPQCCSPEHALRQPVTPASDIYCLAITMCSWVSEWIGVACPGEVQLPHVAIMRCAVGEYPHWDRVEERITATCVIELMKNSMSRDAAMRPQDGAAFAARCRGLLGELATELLDRPVVPMEQVAPWQESREALETCDDSLISLVQ